ncbi:MAG: iron-containing alcohol dehydrogenase [Pseudomonadota bacterium]
MLQLNVPIPRFLSAGEMFAGHGSVAVLRALPASRVALIGSRSLLRGSAGDAVRGAIKALDTCVIEAPRGEASLAALEPVIRQLAEFSPDWIVAAGGGSVIDSAKLAWVFHEHPDLDHELLTRPFALPPLRGRCNFVAVPTTAGAGSEVSSAAVFDAGAGSGKQPVVSHDLLPDLVVLDPKLALGVPREAAIAAGFDALAHALESYVSLFDNAMVDMLAEQAVRTLLTDLPRSVVQPEDTAIRLRLMQAAMMAGWAQNLKVPGAGHALAHQLGAYGIAHGAATGALLGPAMRFNCKSDAVRSKYDALAQSLGLTDAEHLIARIAQLRSELEVSNPFSSLGELDKSPVLVGALEDVCARANPRELDEKGLESILNEAIAA